MSEKKTNYTGVYKDTQSGTYSYRFRYGLDRKTGLPYQEHRRGFKTAKEADAARTLSKLKVQEMGGMADHQMTFEQFTREIFMPDYYGRIVTQLNDDQHYLFEELIQVFGKKKPRDITIFELAAYKNRLLKNHRRNGGRKKFMLLQSILKSARNYGLLHEVLTEKVGNIPAEKVQINFWTKEEFLKIIQSLDINDFQEHFVYTMLWLYYMTGMRVGEGTSLWWSENIDFEKGKIKVFNNLDYKSKRVWNRKTKLKTESSRRIISIDNKTIEVLAVWKKRQAQQFPQIDFVLSVDGSPTSKHSIRSLIIKYARRAGVKVIQPKGLRHSHASLLINEYNVTPLLIQKRLGHSKIETTLNTYSHLYPNADEKIVTQLDGLFKTEKLPKLLPIRRN